MKAGKNSYALCYQTGLTLIELLISLVIISIVVTLWWCVINPIIYYHIWDMEEAVLAFNQANFSHLFLLVHVANLPIAAVDFVAQATPLTAFDMWIALVFGFSYFLFYLLVLDARGVHLYVILSPRFWACPLVYLGILALYCLFFFLWNAVLQIHSLP